MLVLGRGTGRKVLIGDHSIITVVSISPHEVRLGFETLDLVKRVDSMEVVAEFDPETR